MPDRLADLHTHTLHSDGVLRPAALVQKAAARGLGALAVTDHDTVAGVAEAQAEGARCGVEVVAGIELSVTVGDEPVHMLGYYFDPGHRALLEHLEAFRAHRLTRVVGMVEKLNALGVPLTVEAVLAEAGEGVLARPHVAAALVAGGFVRTHQEAFERYIGDEAPAHVGKPRFPAADALALLHEAGGVGVLAHPGSWTREETLKALMRAGLDGVEVVHPSHGPLIREYYRDLAHRRALLQTGGSDYHGFRLRDEDNFGRYTIPLEHVDGLRRFAA